MCEKRSILIQRMVSEIPRITYAGRREKVQDDHHRGMVARAGETKNEEEHLRGGTRRARKRLAMNRFSQQRRRSHPIQDLVGGHGRGR